MQVLVPAIGIISTILHYKEFVGNLRTTNSVNSLYNVVLVKGHLGIKLQYLNDLINT